jgi:hypothetical protein
VILHEPLGQDQPEAWRVYYERMEFCHNIDSITGVDETLRNHRDIGRSASATEERPPAAFDFAAPAVEASR